MKQDIIISHPVPPVDYNNNSKKNSGQKRTSSIKCERILESKTHAHWTLYASTRKYKKKKQYIFFFSLPFAIPFFGYLRRQCEKKKKHLLKFPSQVYVRAILVTTRWPDWAIDPSIELNPSSLYFPLLTEDHNNKKESLELFGRRTRRPWRKKIESLPSLFIDRSECAGRELTISRCLFPIDM